MGEAGGMGWDVATHFEGPSRAFETPLKSFQKKRFNTHVRACSEAFKRHKTNS